MFDTRGSEEIDIHRGECRCCAGDTGIHHDLEPGAEPASVELLVASRPIRTPQVQIEDTCQLARRGQRQQLTAVLESAMLYQPVEHFGLQLWDDSRELRGVQDAIEQPARGTRTPKLFRHGLVMIRALGRNKQSCIENRSGRYY